MIPQARLPETGKKSLQRVTNVSMHIAIPSVWGGPTLTWGAPLKTRPAQGLIRMVRINYTESNLLRDELSYHHSISIIPPTIEKPFVRICPQQASDISPDDPVLSMRLSNGMSASLTSSMLSEKAGQGEFPVEALVTKRGWYCIVLTATRQNASSYTWCKRAGQRVLISRICVLPGWKFGYRVFLSCRHT